MTWTRLTTTLGDCLRILDEQGLLMASVEAEQGLLTVPVTQLAYDSRSAGQGSLFFCKGAHFEPRYLVQAARAGALAYVSEVDYSRELASSGVPAIPLLRVSDVRVAVAELAAYWYRGLLDHLALIGFTGTKGKSTTTYLLASILNSWLTALGKPGCAWLSGIENYSGTTRTPARLTTEEPLELWRHFQSAVENGIEYLCMEVSSQALKYGRTRTLPFTVGGFLSLGEDHISPLEHPNAADYLASKLLLFKQASTAVVNLDCAEHEHVLLAAQRSPVCEQIYTFGTCPEADFWAEEVISTAQGIELSVRGPGWHERFTLPLAGRFNAANALAALAAAHALGVPLQHMASGLSKAEVPGRMQLITAPEGKLVLVDYAHNRLSFATVFATVASEYPTRPLVAVFGATGNKGVERRFDLPQIAAQYAHKIYITEDDPGTEALTDILAVMAAELDKTGVAYEALGNRANAIERAITTALPGSLILVLGKGHETTMKRGSAVVPVPSDSELVKAVIASS